MKTFVFGADKPTSSNSLKLIICEETKQYEKGQCCMNGGHHIDVWVKQKDINAIEQYLVSVGYTKTDNMFGKEN